MAKRGRKKGVPLSEKHRKNLSVAKKGKPNGTKGMHWYNNGVIEVKARECPEGFVPGLIKGKRIGITHHISEETRKRMSELNKGMHYYNNGEIEVRRRECPEGFVQGILKPRALGHPCSEERRQKMRDRYVSQEAIDKAKKTLEERKKSNPDRYKKSNKSRKLKLSTNVSPERYEAICRMHILEYLSFEEIGKKLGITGEKVRLIYEFRANGTIPDDMSVEYVQNKTVSLVVLSTLVHKTLKLLISVEY